MCWVLLTLCIRRVLLCVHSLKSNRTCSYLVPEFNYPFHTCDVHRHPQQLSLPVHLTLLANAIYEKLVCPLLPMAPAWSWLYSGVSHSSTGGSASVHSQDSLICDLASSTKAACMGSSWLLWFQFSLLTTHCYRSSTLGSTLLRDAPKSHS